MSTGSHIVEPLGEARHTSLHSQHALLHQSAVGPQPLTREPSRDRTHTATKDCLGPLTGLGHHLLPPPFNEAALC